MPDAEPTSVPTIVLLHHFGGSARTWDEVIAILGPSYPTLAIDLPGFGDAPADPGPFGVADYADAVEARIDAEGLASIIVVGHSMGGKVALALAARRPPAMRALLLLAPSPPTPEPIDEAARSASIAGWGQHRMAAATLALATANPLTGPAYDRAIEDILRSGQAAWTAWLSRGSREDIAADVAAIDVPVTILSGMHDGVLPTALLRREVEGRLPTSSVRLVQRSGHLLNLEAPHAVADAIRRTVEFHDRPE